MACYLIEGSSGSGKTSVSQELERRGYKAVDADHDNNKKPYGETWRRSYIPVAREFSTAIFGVSNVGPITDGPWKGRKCIGCSLAISASGEEILQGPYGINAECILYIDVKIPSQPAQSKG